MRSLTAVVPDDGPSGMDPGVRRDDDGMLGCVTANRCTQLLSATTRRAIRACRACANCPSRYDVAGGIACRVGQIRPMLPLVLLPHEGRVATVTRRWQWDAMGVCRRSVKRFARTNGETRPVKSRGPDTPKLVLPAQRA
ncbi:hypothetical protein BRAO285_560012 [Bradyrhizobium sp. ORS 285]|nr:hypothetical protein BRAO285_560012 [Bradyrhizobium sp. ORS 285]